MPTLNWQYFVASAFVARMSSDSLEILDLKSNIWHRENDPKMRESLIKDCVVVSEQQAMEIRDRYQK